MLRLPWYLTVPISIALIYAALAYLASRSVYFPSRYPEGFWDAQAQLHAADVWPETRDHIRIHGWFVRHPTSRLATLFLHGNAGNITHRHPHCTEITAAGSSVLVIDYRGYGKSAGRPAEAGLYADADAAYDWLSKQGFRAQDIVLHGESLGTTVAVDLAVRRPCAGLVLEAPFTNAKEVAATVFPVAGPLLIWGFDSKAKISRITAPKLFLQGDRDEIIPPSLGKALYDIAPGPKSFWVVRGAGHNDILETAGPEYRAHLKSFYESLGGM